EVGRESPHQLDGLVQVEGTEELGDLLGGGGVLLLSHLLGEAPHLLHEIEETGTVLAGQCVAQLVSQATDVVAESLVAIRERHGPRLLPTSRRPSLRLRRRAFGSRAARSPRRSRTLQGTGRCRPRRLRS